MNTVKTSLVSERSFELLDDSVLERLAEIALEDLEGLFERRPEKSGLYKDRLMILCLCQGGAEHFVRRRHGIKDFDVWTFFSDHPALPFPCRRRGVRDFGPSRFGRHPNNDRFGFNGRSVDIMGRSIQCDPDQSASDCVREWLQGGRTKSAGLIARRPVVAIHPKDLRGKVIWDPNGGLNDTV